MQKKKKTLEIKELDRAPVEKICHFYLSKQVSNSLFRSIFFFSVTCGYVLHTFLKNHVI